MTERFNRRHLLTAGAIFVALGLAGYVVSYSEARKLAARGLTWEHVLSVIDRLSLENVAKMVSFEARNGPAINMGRLVPDFGSLNLEGNERISNGVEVVRYGIGRFDQCDLDAKRKMSEDQKGYGTIMRVDKNYLSTVSWDTMPVGEIAVTGIKDNSSYDFAMGGILIPSESEVSIVVESDLSDFDASSYYRQPLVFRYDADEYGYHPNLSDYLNNKDTYLRVIAMDIGPSIYFQTIDPGVRIAVIDQCNLMTKAASMVWEDVDFNGAAVAIMAKGSGATMGVNKNEYGPGFSVARPEGLMYLNIDVSD